MLARTTDKTGLNYLRWFPWCRAIRMYRVIKVFSVLPELRARVNLTLPEHVFWREGMLRSESCNDQIPHGHPFEFRPRYRVVISNAGGNSISWRCPLSKGSVVQASFVFHQKAREMGCCELCQQRSVWRGRCESMEIRLQNWKRQIHSLEQVSCSWPGRSSNTGMPCIKRKHKS